MTGDIHEREKLRDRVRVFRDRDHGGEVLAEMLLETGENPALLLALPAGGVPVAVRVSSELGLPLEAAVVSKVTLPWNTEAGYGAVAFDGTVRLNDRILAAYHLSDEEIRSGIEETKLKVRRRVRLFGGERHLAIDAKRLLVVDDGLASGFTMEVAVGALRGAGAEHLAVAVPTGHADSVARIAAAADAVYCPNIRAGYPFAVAEAYRHWRDVEEEEALRLLTEAKSRPPTL